MKCKYCGYKHGWDNEELDIVEGEHGDFYTLSNGIAMTRSSNYYGEDTENLYGCPSCGKMFMDIK